MDLLRLIINMIIHPSLLLNDNSFVFRIYLLLLHKLHILDFVNSFILVIKCQLCRCIHAKYHCTKADSDH